MAIYDLYVKYWNICSLNHVVLEPINQALEHGGKSMNSAYKVVGVHCRYIINGVAESENEIGDLHVVVSKPLKCDLITTLQPPEEITYTLPTRANALYLRYGNSLYYVIKSTMSFWKIPNVDIARFDSEMKPTSTCRTLSDNEINQITRLTGHVYNDKGTTDGIAAGYKAQKLLGLKNISPKFNHTYLYYNPLGLKISELSDEGDLFNFLFAHEKTFELDAVKRLIGQLFLGVENYHKNNVCHRDIKPENVLVSTRKGKFFLKFADQDDLIEVNPTTGAAIGSYIVYTGSHEYHSPELTALGQEFTATKDVALKQSIAGLINWKTVDCYALGLTIWYMMATLLKAEIFAPYFQKVESLKKASPTKLRIGHTQEAYFAQMYYALLGHNINSVNTIEEAKASQFFGGTAEIREAFFKAIDEEADCTLEIDCYPFEPNVENLSDPIPLLNGDIKDFANFAIETCEIIEVASNSLDNQQLVFSDVVNTSNKFKSIADEVKKYNQAASEVRATSQTQAFFACLNEFEETMHAEINRIDQTIYQLLPTYIHIMIDVAHQEYDNRVRTQINVPQNTSVTQFGIFPTLHQKFTSLNILQLKENLARTSNYIDSFNIMRKFIGEENSYSDSSIQNHLMNKLCMVLHKPLIDIEKEIAGMSRGTKRLRTA